jgi:hypothetical protein
MALDQKMISMKRSAADKRADKLEHSPMEATAPDYPWGLCLHMDGDEMDKLGIKTMPKVGDEMILVCKCKVTRCMMSSSEYTDGDETRSIDLQITDIGWEEGA